MQDRDEEVSQKHRDGNAKAIRPVVRAKLVLPNCLSRIAPCSLWEFFDDLPLMHPLGYTTTSSLQYAIGLACALNLDQGCVFDFISIFNFIKDSQLKTIDTDDLRQERLVALCRDIRFQMQLLALFVRMRVHSKRLKYTRIFESIIEIFLTMYVVFALLEARIRGKFPVWEGILLARTRIER